MQRIIILWLVVLALTTRVHAAEAPGKDPMVEQVEKAIESGKKYLKEVQIRDGRDKGSWEVNVQGRRGGFTCLALLALLTAGEDPRSATIQDGMKFLRDQIQPKDTYVVGLQTMVYTEYHIQTGEKGDLLRIEANVKWLIDNMIADKDGTTKGWGYTANGRNPDNSNTQYALLGLHAGKTAGIKIDREVWEKIRNFYKTTQLMNAADKGSWAYQPGMAGGTLTMTTAGLSGLLISSMEINDTQSKLKANGSVENCGQYPENDGIELALKYVASKFNVDRNPHAIFYNLYGLERAGRLSGRRWFGENDWYREGCEYLTKAKSGRANDGSWSLRGQSFDGWPVVSTSFSLLFLSKGRTPVLISKLVHHRPDEPDDGGWNNKHYDMRNLTEFVSQNLFKKKPLAWQVFNAKQTGMNAETLAPELLQTPIAYLNGHRFRTSYFSGAEKKMLQQYVEQGGFILAEACCNEDKEFGDGFRALMEELFDKNEHPMKILPPTHPIYTAYYPLVADRDKPLYGMEFGCKTLVVYSPNALAGWWEANQPTRDAASKRAFQLGANIVAYATGMELPKPRGTQVEIFTDKPESKLPRGHLKVAQLEHPGERHSGIGVTRNLLAHMRTKLGIDVALQTEKMKLGDKDLLNYKFVYMHGKGEFNYDEKELKLLKANLEHGNGLLFADACCGSKAFDTSFRKMIKTMFGKDLEEIPASVDDEKKRDELYSESLNGVAITSVKCRREKSGGDSDKGYKEGAPFLEGIKVGDRWVVIYSKYDIGCALEKHASTDCLGHDHESALRLGSAVIMYALQR